MGQNILMGVLCAVVLGVGIWGWWFDNGGSFKKDDRADAGLKETENEKKNVK